MCSCQQEQRCNSTTGMTGRLPLATAFSIVIMGPRHTAQSQWHTYNCCTLLGKFTSYICLTEMVALRTFKLCVWKNDNALFLRHKVEIAHHTLQAHGGGSKSKGDLVKKHPCVFNFKKIQEIPYTFHLLKGAPPSPALPHHHRRTVDVHLQHHSSEKGFL